MNIPGTLLFQEVVGSRAYGLATEKSDTDRLGVFVAPTKEIVGLNWGDHHATVTSKDELGDMTYHEIGKALRLWLSCNPTITELLWMDTINNVNDTVPFKIEGVEDESRFFLYRVRRELRELRSKLLFTAGVMGAYGGYARAQVRRIERREKDFSSDTKHRTAKHARHCMRLLLQGEQLLTSGTLKVDCSDDRDWLFSMGELAEKDVGKFVEHWEKADQAFMRCVDGSVLPQKPDRDAANKLLVQVRQWCW